MDEKDKKVTKEEKLQNNQTIYLEVSESRRRSHKDLELLNNKINWLFGSTLVMAGFLLNAGFNDSPLYLLAYTFLFLSAVVCLKIILPNKYADGPKLRNVHELRNNLDTYELLASINKKIIDDMEANNFYIRKFKDAAFASAVSVGTALVLVGIKFFSLF